VQTPRHLNGDEIKVARSLIKMLNVGHFDPYLIAYHFVSHAPGAVLENLMELFDKILDVLAENYDNDMCRSNQEYNAAITAKRVQDALEIWRQGT
jgi:hypothetical protein